MAQARTLTEDRRLQILDAAIKAIVERGLWDTRVADIAERAGTSAALILYYFGSKDRLLTEALTFAEDAFYLRTFQELTRMGSARDKLVRAIELSFPRDRSEGEIDEWSLWLDLWARAARDPEVSKHREALDHRWMTTVADIVREGQAAGEFAEVDPEDFALRFAALMDGLAIQLVLRDSHVDTARVVEMLLSFAERELGFRRA